MHYQSQSKVDLTIYHQLVYEGLDIRRDLAVNIIREMSDEDFDKIFTTTVKDRYEFRPEMEVTVELKIR